MNTTLTTRQQYRNLKVTSSRAAHRTGDLSGAALAIDAYLQRRSRAVATVGHAKQKPVVSRMQRLAASLLLVGAMAAGAGAASVVRTIVKLPLAPTTILNLDAALNSDTEQVAAAGSIK